MVHEQLTLLLLGERLIGTVSQHLGTLRRYLSSSILFPHSKGSRKDCADQSYHKRRCFPTIECILDSVSTKSPPWTGTAEALPLRFGENNKQRISSLNRKQKMKWQGLATELCEMPRSFDGLQLREGNAKYIQILKTETVASLRCCECESRKPKLDNAKNWKTCHKQHKGRHKTAKKLRG